MARPAGSRSARAATLAVNTSGWQAADITSLVGAGGFADGSYLGIDTTGSDLSIAAVPISGNHGFRKLGTGTLTLTGASTYTGRRP